jgi:hypothetical protein
MIEHDNGAEQKYLSCRPLGKPGDATTYHPTMLKKAMEAYAPGVMATEIACPENNGMYCAKVQDGKKGDCAIWCVDGILAGHVWVSKTKSCYCPDSTTAPENHLWN